MEIGIRVCKGPGKFEGELLIAKAFYRLSLEAGCSDERVGKYGHWYGLMRGPFHDIEEIEPGVPLTEAERAYLDRIAGVILCETDAGYVYAYYYEDPAEMEKVWEEVLEGLGEL